MTDELDKLQVAQLAHLQALLQGLDTHVFERLTAALIAHLLDLPIAVAKGGFQHGADAGPVGRGQRRFRIECKRYSDKTPLNDRLLEGEIDDALNRDPGLEAWVLVSTREVAEQTEQTLLAKSEKVGVPVLIIDWKQDTPPALAALCTSNPSIVARYVPDPASHVASQLSDQLSRTLESIKRDFQTWVIGFEPLRQKSHAQLETIWTSSSAAYAVLGQNSAGGAPDVVCIDRSTINAPLDKWWKSNAVSAPAVILGIDGVGKTWAGLNWLMRNRDVLPIVTVVPASSASSKTLSTITGAKLWLAEQLHELTQVQSSEHWLQRLHRLLARPVEDGPVLVLFVDGINQAPELPWPSFFRVLQNDPFYGRVRLLTSTRKLHFEERLGNLRALETPGALIPLNEFDDAPGGEFDQMLHAANLTRSDLHPDLIPLARNPRLFRLVIRLREQFSQSGDVTIHRLLWEYGRDTLGQRPGHPFSEAAWHAWLRTIAETFRSGITEFTTNALAATVAAHHLSPTDVFLRLSEIVDGHFHTTAKGALSPVLVYHALAIALLDRLRGLVPGAYEEPLQAWLDPIAGLDQRSEILRAAVSILIATSKPEDQPLKSVLLTVWMLTQNLPPEHRDEVRRLATPLRDALLDTIEKTNAYSQRTTRDLAVDALRALPRNDRTAWAAIEKRLHRWLTVISKDADRDHKDGWITKELRANLGTDEPGNLTMLGTTVTVVDNADNTLQKVAASLIDRFPPSNFGELPLAAAIQYALRHDSTVYDALQWIQLFNETHSEQVRESIRSTAQLVLAHRLEPCVSERLRKRIASLLYWLTGYRDDEVEARVVAPEPYYSYEKEYLPNPSQSSFALERRHADIALKDRAIALRSRIRRTAEMWLDPAFDVPPSFADEVREVVNSFDVSGLDNHFSLSLEDHNFKDLEPVLARVDPELLALFVRRKLHSLADKPAESRHWSSIRGERHFLLVDAEAKASARTLRASWHGAFTTNDDIWAQSELLGIEIIDATALEQTQQVVEADFPLLYVSLAEVMRTQDTKTAASLVHQFSNAEPSRQKMLAHILSRYTGPLPDLLWDWMKGKAFDDAFEGKPSVWRILASSSPRRFGQLLEDADWSWDPLSHPYVNHFGSIALAEATKSHPFEIILPRLAPWLLPKAARSRGSAPEEVRMVASTLEALLDVNLAQPTDVDSEVSLNCENREREPFSVTISAKTGSDHDPIASLKVNSDYQARSEAIDRASKAALHRIKEARRQGASLYLMNFSAEDFTLFIEHAASTLNKWLEGVHERSPTFRTRVNLAVGAYHALCEALLAIDPEKGSVLWRALRQVRHTRIVGPADIDDLLHMVFRVPPSTALELLLNETFQICTTNTDQELLELCIAAELNGRGAWIKNFIDKDRASTLTWRRRRAVVMESFLTDHTLPIADAWPDGPPSSDEDTHARRAAKWKYRAACMRHWWRAFVTANTAESAYAAWTLFAASADRRARIIQSQNPLIQDGSLLAHRKFVHFLRNQDNLDTDTKERDLDSEFLFTRVSAAVFPWRTEPADASRL